MKTFNKLGRRHFQVADIAPFFVMNRAGDKDAARAAWRERFNNRAPAAREPKTIDVRAAADATEILLHDEIGFWGITSKAFAETLSAISTPKITVRINSPGGDVFAGMAIYNSLKSYKGDVSVVIDGLAASAASFIAMAGNTISIHESAMLMVHKAWGLTIGNETDHVDMAGTLRKIDGQIAAIYAKQTGKSVDDMLALMAGESDGTWFTAAEAAEANFVDEVITDEDDKSNAKNIFDEADAARIAAMRRRLAIAERD